MFKNILKILGAVITIIGLIILAVGGIGIGLESWQNFLYFSWIIPLIILIYMLYKWYFSGRDPKSDRTIIAEYDVPDNLTPSETAGILNLNIDYKDLIAEIIKLAGKGYLQIVELPDMEDFKLIMLKDSNDLDKMDRKLMGLIFSNNETQVRLSDIQRKLLIQLSFFKQEIMEDLTARGYFPENPDAVRGRYWVIGILIFSLFYLLGIIKSEVVTPLIFPALFGGGIILYFANFLPKRTAKGVNIYKQILGFKHYLEVAEIDKLKFHFHTENIPEIYDQLLPYAMVLGVKFKWAGHFSQHLTEIPIDPNVPRGLESLGATFDEILKYKNDYYKIK